MYVCMYLVANQHEEVVRGDDVLCAGAVEWGRATTHCNYKSRRSDHLVYMEPFLLSGVCLIVCVHDYV